MNKPLASSKLLTRTILISAATFIMVGCGSGKSFQATTEFPPPPPITLSHSCTTPMQAILVKESPVGFLPVGTEVTWRVSAQGCTKRFFIDNGTATRNFFESTTTFNKKYDAAGKFTEKVRVIAVEPDGTGVEEFYASSMEFEIGGNTNPPPPPPAPTCMIARGPAVTVAGQQPQFVMTVVGSFDAASVNGNTVTPGLPFNVAPSAANTFQAFGMIVGPGGGNLCQATVILPSCTLATTGTTSPVPITMTLAGPISAALIDTQNQTLPVPPANQITIQKVVGFGNFQASGEVTSSAGDKGFCSVNYAVPDVRIVPVSVSGGQNTGAGPNAYDKNEATFWNSGTGFMFQAQWIAFNLGSNRALGKIRIKTGAATILKINFFFHTATDCSDDPSGMPQSTVSNIADGQWVDYNITTNSAPRCVSIDRLQGDPGPPSFTLYEVEFYPK